MAKAKVKKKKKVIATAKKKVRVKAKTKLKAREKVGARAKVAAKTKAKVKSKTKVKAKVKAKAKVVSLVGRGVGGWEAPVTGGSKISSEDLLGKKVVLYFYPKDMTPGCTIEGHEFTRLKDEFAKKNAVVYGVSRDTVDSHERFKSNECYTIDLISDADEKLCQAFGVIKDKNMYGKIVRGIERSTFVLNERGEVVKEWRGVKAEGHAQEVLSYLQEADS